MKLFQNLMYLVIAAIAAVILLTTLAGCATQKQAQKYYAKHPEALAKKCSDAFPVVDSVAFISVDTTAWVVNINYSRQIDSLSRAVDSLNDAFSGIVDSAGLELSLGYQRELLRLQRQLAVVKEGAATLRQEYKPCLPDTVTITRTRVVRDKAYEATQTDQIKKLAGERDEMKQDASRLKSKANLWLLIAVISIALNCIGVLLFFKFR